MKKSLVIICLLACICGWYSCTRDRAIAYVASPCDSTQVTYHNNISRIVSTYCTNTGGCHNPASGLGTGYGGITANDLTTLSAVKNEDMDTIGSTSIVCWMKQGCGTELMPKGGRELAADRDTFLMWKANNYCQ